MKGVIERKRPVKLFKLMIDEATFFHFKAGHFCGLLIYIGATGDAAPAAEVNKDENNGTFTPFSMHIVPHPSLSLFFKHLFFFFKFDFIAFGFLVFYSALHRLQIKKGKKTVCVR